MSEISVIVPVYNVEKYLKRCVDSILNQSYKDFELILVDDGSKDSSGKICDEYGQTDSRVKVIHKKNGGVSAARNTGLKFATGEYIMFVDSDDYIDESMLLEMIKYAESDIITSGLRFVDINENLLFENNNDTIEKMNINEFIKNNYVDFYKKYIFSGPYNKLYKRYIIIQENLFFNENLSICEDGLFVINYLLVAKTISNVSKCFYNYVQYSENNLMSKYNSNAIDASLQLYNTKQKLISINECDNEDIMNFLNNEETETILGFLSQIYSRSKLNNNEKYKKLKSEIQKSQVKNLLVTYKAKSFKSKFMIFLIKNNMFLLLHISYVFNYSSFIRKLILKMNAYYRK